MVFYAFAKPEYITSEPATSTEKISTVAEALNELIAPMPEPAPAVKKDTVKQVGKIRVVKGKVVNQEGKPLGGTTVIINGTNTGVITDKEGNFKMKNVPKGGELVFSFGGYQTVTVKSDAGNAMLIKLEEAVVVADKNVVIGYPVSNKIQFRSKFADKQPLYLLNGAVINQTKMDALNPEDISSIEVLKDQSATNLYGDNAKNGVIRISTKTNFINDPLKDPLFVLDGEIINKARMETVGADKIESITVLKDGSAIVKYGNKARNGVIEIVTKNKAVIDSKNEVNKVFLVVEEMPEFAGGKEALANFIASNINYPEMAKAEKAEGRVVVSVVVSSTGKVKNAKIIRGIHPALDAEAMRVIGLLPLQPDWKPGKEKGVAVDVSVTVPVEFKL